MVCGVFERYIPWMIYTEDRDICEFYFRVPNRPVELRRALEVFAKHDVTILSINAYSLPEWDRAPVFVFADLTGLDVDVESIKDELERVTGEAAHYKRPPVRGFMMDEFAFPLSVFPGVRSLVLLELDFEEMIKGLYERLPKVAGTFLYYLAHSGGKFLAEYLSEKFKLKGRDLLVEVLKFYQAGGWGRVELVRCRPEEPDIVLRLYDSIECKAFKGSNECASHFIRGHLSGLLSRILNADVRVMESKCIAKGDPYCEFYVEEVSS